MKSLILILAINILIFSCSNDSVSQTTNVEFTEIAEGFLGGEGSEGISKQNIVIENETDWNNLKLKMNLVNNETDHFNETDINFSSFMIIASFEEVKNEGEYKLSITEVVKKAENILVKINLESLTGSNTIQVITQPYYIAKIPKSHSPIMFE